MHTSSLRPHTLDVLGTLLPDFADVLLLGSLASGDLLGKKNVTRQKKILLELKKKMVNLALLPLFQNLCLWCREPWACKPSVTTGGGSSRCV
jgi:hypothetical protein